MGSFLARLDIQHAGQMPRLVGDKAHGPAIQADEGGDDIAGIGRFLFADAVPVADQFDNPAHIV